MAVSKAQQKAVNKYMSANYDRVNVTMPKGRKDAIKAHAIIRNESVNGFINRAISEAMERDIAQDAPEKSGSFESAFSLEALQTAQKAAAATGETVPQFIERAVITQEKRDSVVLKMGGKPTGEK